MKITVRKLQDTAANRRTLTRAAASTRTLTGNLPPANGGDFPAAPTPALFHNGDGFSFIGRDGKEHGFRADVCEGDTILCRAVDGIAPGTRLYRNLDTVFEKELEKGAVRKIDVSLSVEINEIGSPTASLSEEGDVRSFQVSVRAVSEDGREVQNVTDIMAEPARNRERMLGMIAGQLGKDAGIYSFAVEGIHFGRTGSGSNGFGTKGTGSTCSGSNGFDTTGSGSNGSGGAATDGSGIPVISAAQLNAIRRSLAEELDRMPCNARPLNRAAIRDSLPEALKFPQHISYKSDVANSLAASLYRRLGAETVEPAYEARNRGLWKAESPDAASTAENKAQTNREHPDGIELMRSKYCLLNELGLCHKTPAYAALSAANDLRSGLFLRNNGRLLRVDFNCTNCEMVVLSK